MSSVRPSQAVDAPYKSKSFGISSSAPSPAPSNASNGKRKRDDGKPDTPYSQPASTGSGHEIMTQVIYAVDHIKEKDRLLSFDEILGYLSLQKASDHERRTLQHILRNHNRVEYDRSGNNGQGSYRYRPIHNVRSADELKGYLQKRATAQGVSVKELKDGWKGADKAIADLERQGDLLVTHMKKDNAPKMVWQNDPSLVHPVDERFHKLWHLATLPANPDELRTKLEQAGLKPASAPKQTTVARPKDKKRKAPRRGGRQTNTHMIGILRDFSAQRK